MSGRKRDGDFAQGDKRDDKEKTATSLRVTNEWKKERPFDFAQGDKRDDKEKTATSLGVTNEWKKESPFDFAQGDKRGQMSGRKRDPSTLLRVTNGTTKTATSLGVTKYANATLGG